MKNNHFSDFGKELAIELNQALTAADECIDEALATFLQIVACTESLTALLEKQPEPETLRKEVEAIRSATLTMIQIFQFYDRLRQRVDYVAARMEGLKSVCERVGLPVDSGHSAEEITLFPFQVGGN